MQPHARFRDKLYDFTLHVKYVIFASHQETVTAQAEGILPTWSDSFISVRPPIESGGISLVILITSSSPLLPSPRLPSANKINPRDRAIFNWVLKVIQDWIGFALLCCLIGLENSRHPLSQSDVN